MNNKTDTIGTKTLLVADELELVAVGLRDKLASTNLTVIAHTSTGEETLQWLQQQTVDIILMDVSLPKLDGIDTMRAIRKSWPEQIVIGHSLLNEIEYINSMLIEGARGYIVKEATVEEITTAVDTIMAGNEYLSPAAQAEVEKGYSYTEKHMGGEYMGLSSRERQIIKGIAREKTNQEIADEMFISIETVRTYRKSLMTKLNVKSAAGLVKYAVDRRWV